MDSKENFDFRPDLVDFVKILMDEITYFSSSVEDQKLLLHELFDLYNDGFWDTEANINIRNDIHLFLMGFNFCKRC